MPQQQKPENYYSNSRVKKGFVHFLTGRGIASIASFGVAILLVRELSIADYAIYTALSGLLLFIMLLSNAGIERVVPRFLPEIKLFGSTKKLINWVWKLCLYRLVTLFICLIPFVLFSDEISKGLNFIFNLELLFLFTVYLVGFGFSMHLVRTLQALLMQKQAMIGFAIEWFLKLTALISLLFYGINLDLNAVFWVQAITVWLGILYLLFSLNQFLKENTSEEEKEYSIEMKKVYSFALDNYFQTLLGFHTLPPTSKLIGASLFAAPALAALGFAYTIVGVMQRYLPVKLLLGLVEPVLMARYAESKDFSQTTHLVGILLKLNLFVIIPMAFWFLLSGEGLIDFITKNKYGESAWLIAALLFILVLGSQRDVLQLICNSVDQSRLLFKSNLFSLWLLPVWLYLASTFSLVGLVCGLSIILIFRNSYIMYKLGGLGFRFYLDWKAVVIITMLAIFSNSVGFWLSTFYFMNLQASIVSLIIAIILYLLLAYFIKPFTARERKALNGFIGKRIFIW